MRVNIIKLAILAISATTVSGFIIANRNVSYLATVNASDPWALDAYPGHPHSQPPIIGEELSLASQNKNRHIFGVNLPANKTGWVESGEAFTWWKKLGWTSIDPATGKRREHLKLCQKHKKRRIPDDAECCRNDIFWCWCRTYKKVNKKDVGTGLDSASLHVVDG